MGALRRSVEGADDDEAAGADVHEAETEGVRFGEAAREDVEVDGQDAQARCQVDAGPVVGPDRRPRLGQPRRQQFQAGPVAVPV